MKQKKRISWPKSAVLFCAAAFGLSAFATTYTWTGGGTDNNWTTPANWGLEEGYPNAADAEVTFPAGNAVTVTGESSVHTGVMTINCDVTLTGSFTLDTITDATITEEAPDGTCTVTLDTVELAQGTGFSITAPVVVANTVKNTSNGAPTFNKAVSGSGTISNTATSGSAWCGFIFKGDCSNFTGTYSGGTRATYSRDGTQFWGGSTASAQATYTVGNSNGTTPIKTSGTSEAVEKYCFGTLNGGAINTLNGVSYVNLEIGALNGDSTLYITVPGSNNSVTKVGTGSLTLTATLPLTLSAGTVTLANASYIPTAITMADGTTLAFSADVTSSEAFITATGTSTINVASDNTVTLADEFASLVKTGDGILTLTTVPTGTITVSAGYVYLPANAEPTLDADTTGSVSTTAGLMLFNNNDVNVWTGAANDNTWATGENWSKGAAPSAATDVVIIPEGDALSITTSGSSTDRTGILTINRDVTFTGNGKGITIDEVSGSGTLTVNAGTGKVLYFSSGSPARINCDLCVYNTLNAGSNTYNIYGALKGTGYIKFGSSNQPGFLIHGDVSEFTGAYDGGSRDNGDRDGTQFLTGIESEAGAWTIGFDDSSNYKSPFRAGDGATYKFGVLNTHAYNSGYNRLTMYVTHSSKGDTYAKNVTLEVGARANETSSIGGTLFNGTTGDTTAPNKIVKVGDTSTLNLRLTSADGAVEVEGGTLNLVAASTAYAPVSCTITGTGATVVVPDAVANSTLTIVEDDPETDEDESSTTGTAFAPVLSDELQAAYCELKTVEGDGVTTYSLYDIAQVGETTYKTIADAVAAATGDDKAIKVIRTTEEPVVLATAGQTLTCAENVTCGAVSAVAGLVVEEENGVYTAADNTASDWTNEGGDNLWGTAANWSTGYVPDSATVVTLPDGAAIYTGTAGTAGYCGGMVVNGEVTIAYNANMGSYTAIQCNGDITGEGTLTLARAGINGNNKAVTISADLAIENDTAAYTTSGHDSWLENGTFTIDGDVTVSGLFRTYAATTFNGAVSIVDGGTITSYGGSAPTFNGAVTLTGQSGIYTYAVTYNGAVTMGDDAVISVGSSTQTYGSGFVLNGSGTWIGDTQNPASAVQTNLRGNNNNTWTGVCELYNFSVTTLTPSSYANNNSTVRLKGITAGNIAAGTYACGIELAGNGLTISGDYSRNITFSGEFSGSGALKVGTVGASGFNLYITGDYSGFTGGVQFTNSSTRTRRVVFGASSTTSTGSCVVIAEGASLTVDSGAVWGPTNLVVLGEITFNGTLNIPAGGIWGSGNTGNRTIRFNDLSKAPNCAMFAGSWNGTCVLGDPASSSTEIKLYNFGNASSTIELAGVTAGYIGINGNTNVTSKVVLSGNVKLTNGWPTTVQSEGSMPTTRLTTLASLGGEGDLELNYTGTSSSWSSSSKGHIVVNKLDGAYTGDISIGNYWLLEVDAVDFAAAPTTAGEALIGVTVAENGTLYNAAHNAVTTSNGKAIDVTVAGVASTEKLVLGSDGLYLAVASVGSTYYATLQDAVDAAGENTVTLLVGGQSATLTGGASVKIAKGEYDCTINVPAGYSISESTDEGVTTYTTEVCAATVTHGETVTPYTTLAGAIAEAESGDTVTLLADVELDTTTAIAKNLTLDLGEKTLTGRVTISDGTVIVQNGTIVGRFDVYDSSAVTIAATATITGYVVVWGDGTYGEEGCKTPTLNLYGKVTNTEEDGTALFNGSTDTSKPTINIYSGAAVSADWAIQVNTAVLNVSGGTITGADRGIEAKGGSAVTLSGGSVTATGSGIGLWEGSSLTMTDGTVSAAEFGVFNNGAQTSYSTTMTISGGTITSTGTDACGIYQAGPGTLALSGTAAVSGYDGLEVRAGSFTIADSATVTATATTYTAPTANGSGSTGHGGAAVIVAQHTTKLTTTATITGGTLSGVKKVVVGNFNDDMTGVSVTVSSTTDTVVPDGYEWAASGEVYVLTESSSGLDPASETLSTETTYTGTETGEALTNAVVAATTIAVPSQAATALEAAATAAETTADALYKSYFTYTVEETSSGSGVYTVTITGLADEVTETANANALEALEAATAGGALSAEVAVKPGLYYGTAAGDDVTTLKASAGTLNTTGSLDLSGVTKPTAGEAYFIKIKVGATAFTAEE